MDKLYAKQETLLGDLRGGLCSSGLCRQLRAVAADEIERRLKESESLGHQWRTLDARLQSMSKLLTDILFHLPPQAVKLEDGRVNRLPQLRRACVYLAPDLPYLRGCGAHRAAGALGAVYEAEALANQ